MLDKARRRDFRLSGTQRRSHWSLLRETESRYIRRGEPNELD
ncbi:hypothetical protein [Nostoc sp. ChiQUE01b]|nr:hypothetical protein [Nostoc sp. ChiQUE01b]